MPAHRGQAITSRTISRPRPPGSSRRSFFSLDEDVAKHYRTGDQVIDALRRLIAEGRAPEPREG